MIDQPAPPVINIQHRVGEEVDIVDLPYIILSIDMAWCNGIGNVAKY